MWSQTDPKAEHDYARSPYAVNYGNPISFADPHGDEPITLAVIAVAAIVGGGVNVYSNWSSVVQNPWSAAGYFATGAVAAPVGLTNPAAGFSIAAAGNAITDVASGNLVDLSHWTDVVGYAGGLAMDGLSVVGAGKVAQMGVNGLKSLGKDAVKNLAANQLLAEELGSELGYEFLRDASGEIIWDGAAKALLTQVSGQATVVGHSLIQYAGVGALGLGAVTSTGNLGAQAQWDINGPNTTAKWQGPKGSSYTEFGPDGTVWSKSRTQHADAYKVFKKGSKGLEWYRDADQYGNYIDPLKKHKSASGRSIPWNKLKKIF